MIQVRRVNDGAWLKRIARSRRLRHWLLPVLAAVLAACIYAVYVRPFDPLIVAPTQLTLPADGREHVTLTLQRRSSLPLTLADFRALTPTLRLVPADGEIISRTIRGLVQAPVTPGKSAIYFTWRRRNFSVPVQFAYDGTDTYADGTPDFLRLHSAEDREAFRNWFTAIAAAEAAQPADNLPAEIDDCAALLRYSYREALRYHDEDWLVDQHPLGITPMRSVQQYRYPQTPLGASIYRVLPGPFLPGDIANGSYGQFADARTLMHLNMHFTSRDIHTAQKGDLIFYRQLEQNSPYHSMIILNSDWVVYHTGPVRHAKGEVRRVSIEDLVQHPDVRWRPVPENSNFLGVYRWNILRDAD
jgi:uncharacterized protein YfaT (DUF1175 family)